jgi:hypothetical protein
MPGKGQSTITISTHDYQLIKEKAKELGISAARFVTNCIREAVKV